MNLGGVLLDTSQETLKFMEILTRDDEIGLRVEVATKGIVAMALQGLQALA